MNTHHVRDDEGKLGVVWFIVPMTWAAVGLAGFVLLSNWPSVFADAVQVQAGALPIAAQVQPYESSDPSLPSASSVFKDGASYPADPQIDTF